MASKAIKALGWIIPLVIGCIGGYILFQLTYAPAHGVDFKTQVLRVSDTAYKVGIRNVGERKIIITCIRIIDPDDDVYIWVGKVELPVDEACCVTCLLAEVHGNGKTEHAGTEVTIEVKIKNFGTVIDFDTATEPEYPWG